MVVNSERVFGTWSPGETWTVARRSSRRSVPSGERSNPDAMASAVRSASQFLDHHF